MAFWDLESHQGDAPALLDAHRQWSYSQLAQLADQYATRLPGNRRTLGFLGFSSDIQAVALYLGALRSRRHVPLLLQPDMDPDLTAALAAHYRPDWLALPAHVAPPPGYDPISGDDDADAITLYAPCVPDGDSPEVHPDLALLLSTSGSTGSSKLVRLSATGLAANADSIVQYLGLTSDDCAVTSLPFEPDALQRVHHSVSQVHRTREERLIAMTGAFAASRDVSGMNLLLVDDVFTTGATATACAAWPS